MRDAPRPTIAVADATAVPESGVARIRAPARPSASEDPLHGAAQAIDPGADAVALAGVAVVTVIALELEDAVATEPLVADIAAVATLDAVARAIVDVTANPAVAGEDAVADPGGAAKDMTTVTPLEAVALAAGAEIVPLLLSVPRASA